ncbi:MAG TPA: glycosyltransferase family A protein [Vicinamibacterales bacterium]|nr:glycosyltransferase family A protein [Vicinamibacterales bacterium]
MPRPARPRVSIVIPAYNAARDIADALDSVFRQTFSDFEAIVVNDASPDTADLERAIEPFSSRIRYVRHPQNRGAGAARNTALAAAGGELVAFLDADDLWFPEFLQRQMQFLDANPGCALVYADARISGESPLAGTRFMQQAPSSGAVTLLSLIAQTCNIPLSTVVMRREPLAAAGGFDADLRRGQDYELWLRLAANGVAMRYQRLVLTERRVRTTGLSGTPEEELVRVLYVLERFGRTQPTTIRSAVRERLSVLSDALGIERAKARLRDADFDGALHHLASTRKRSLKWQLALIGLQVAPRLLRRAYLVTR